MAIPSKTQRPTTAGNSKEETVQVTAKPSKMNGSSRLPKGAEKHVQQMQKKYAAAQDKLEKQTSISS